MNRNLSILIPCSFATSLHMPELCTQPWFSFLGCFAKLRKVTFRFVLSVRVEKFGSHCTDFYEILYSVFSFENL